MKYQLKMALSLSAVAAIIGLCVLAWFSAMERRWTWVAKDDENVVHHDMEAAALLLRKRGHAVEVLDTMGGVNPRDLKDGTLVLTNASALMSRTTSNDLLAWVKRGNTIIVRPRLMNNAEEAIHDAFLRAAARADTPAAGKEDDAADEDEDAEEAAGEQAGARTPVAKDEESDPLGGHFGVRSYYLDDDADDEDHEGHDHGPDKIDPEPKAATPAVKLAPDLITLPGYAYPLETSVTRVRLANLGGTDLTYWGDEHGAAVRGYPTGAGQVVIVASNFFHDDIVSERDNAELLMALARLNQGKAGSGPGAVTIVLHADIAKWYQAIWNHYKLAVISLVCLLLLLLWAAVRRFGPILPQPVNERRSLMEHIDASGVWLWKANGGRQQLLSAARSDTMAVLARRAPALVRMAPDRMAAALAVAAGLEASHVIEALQRDASPQIPLFTRQIRTLQTLRNHYER